MLQDAELDSRVREAQAAVARLIYDAARDAPFATLILEIAVEHGKPVRMFPSCRSSIRFTEPAEAATNVRARRPRQ
jgi:hypothetical protein